MSSGKAQADETSQNALQADENSINPARATGEYTYEWDIATDKLTFIDSSSPPLPAELVDTITTNEAFSHLVMSDADFTRDKVIMTSRRDDLGNGVEFHLQYTLSCQEWSAIPDYWIEETGRWFAGDDGKPARATGTLQLFEERRNYEERLNRLSQRDFLTGLYNRSHLNFCLQKTFREISISHQSAGFVLLGLEHFDLINSVYGYEAGDAILAEVARRLKDNLRERDIIGRFSGAKLGIILSDCDDRDILVAGYRILNLLRENVVITDRGSVAISISIGGVVLPNQAKTPSEVFVAAQQALLESRRARDSAIVVYQYDPIAEARKRQDAQTAERIITALKEGHICLAFQPIVDAASGEIKYHEALVRLQTPNGESLIAENFVGVAERLGLIRLVDHHALDLALEILVDAPTAIFSLNVSNETASDPEWLSKLAMAINAHPTIAERLIVEITESQAAESLTEALRFIEAVRDLGCKVALDDFGAGFTSFRNLKSLPFDVIKIDGQFANDLSNSHINQSFIKALVNLAQLFDAQTVVEWVEDEETASLLNSWGVDCLQGFAFGKPDQKLPWPIVNDDKPSEVA